MNALPASERCHWSSPSKNALRPSLKSDWCVCMRDPFSPTIGLGMKVAWEPAFVALPHPLERAAEDVALVTLVGVAVRGDDVADHPRDLRLAFLPRHRREGRGIRDRDHVGLLDRVEPRDRRSVEAHPVVERVLDL